MSENEQKALALVAEAEKKLNSSKTFLGGLFGYLMLHTFQSRPSMMMLPYKTKLS